MNTLAVPLTIFPLLFIVLIRCVRDSSGEAAVATFLLILGMIVEELDVASIEYCIPNTTKDERTHPTLETAFQSRRN